MKCLLIYDVTDDRLRAKIADICLDYGLERIQYSAFFGELSQNRQGEILQKIRRCLRVTPPAAATERPLPPARPTGIADVRLYPVCERDLGLCKRIAHRSGAVGGDGTGS